MKRAVVLHGTDGKPEDNWFPWIKNKLEQAGFEVWVPLLPENHTPNRDVYNDFLLINGWDFTDNIVIGHSSGAVSVLNLLSDERCPHIRFGVMVGAWSGGLPNGYDKDSTQFDNLFPINGFDFEKIKQKADSFVFIHGDDDPYCPLEQAQFLADKLNAPISIVNNGHHLGSKFKELPILWDAISPKL